MIVRTRYQDIPLDEVRKCARHYPADAWAKHRGTPVSIEARPIRRIFVAPDDTCLGPAYATADGFWVCSHIALIGD